MSVFRDYLRRRGATPDSQFDEPDESWFVFSLLLIRLGLVARLESPPWFEAPLTSTVLRKMPDPLKLINPGVEARESLKFVSSFLCFFVPKGPRYLREIASFKEQYIPNFYSDVEKQLHLYESALPSFAITPLDKAQWETVTTYFRVQENETPLTRHA
jgi:hypothetical protein